MAKGDQINLKPHFKEEKLPCEGTVGDLFVFTPLGEGDVDSRKQGSASLWFCTKGDEGNNKAIWLRVKFDGQMTCSVPPPIPPQDHPDLQQR
ncbi:MAG: hypothetical protein E8D52_01130 [Nitrospira sp.]|nr:MAG: hypothetical protein E8D52_01130 [Nitrospira sp.]